MTTTRSTIRSLAELLLITFLAVSVLQNAPLNAQAQVRVANSDMVSSWFSSNDLQFTRNFAAARELCQLVTVHSFIKSSTGIVYNQQGVGWVVVSQNQELSVLVPAHIVFGAAASVAQCGSEVFELKLSALSETQDLALLSIVRRSPLGLSVPASPPALSGATPDPLSLHLWPLLWLSAPSHLSQWRSAMTTEAAKRLNPPALIGPLTNPGASARFQPQIFVPNVGNETQMSRLNSSGYVLREDTHPALAGTDSLYIVLDSGVRPRMSGSPLLNKGADAGDTNFQLRGMVLKVRK